MREIRFRAYDKATKKICPVWDIGWKAWDGQDGGFNYIRIELDGTVDRFEHEVELMQYTGLKDKNGKEIYEGDIVKGTIDTQKHIKGRVYIESEHGSLWGCYIADGMESEQFGSWDMRQLCWGVDEFTPHCEVIGNIYENPELLGTEKA